ncbi:MAG: hypothetical protein VKL39_21720 [Leptolyngbyaceae bacterium]|nr:hypothetical protein [Leptolyngbyaceae bacterium]
MEIPNSRNGGTNKKSGEPYYSLDTVQFPIEGGSLFSKEFAYELAINSLGFVPKEIRSVQFVRFIPLNSGIVTVDFSPNYFYGMVQPSMNGSSYILDILLDNVIISQVSGGPSFPKSEIPILFNRTSQPNVNLNTVQRLIGYLIVNPNTQ